MQGILVFCALASAYSAFGVEVQVFVCNQGKLPVRTVELAKKDAELIFQSAGVQLTWSACKSPEHAGAARNFTLRLRKGTSSFASGTAALETMGRAFIAPTREGFLLDAYYGAIQNFADPSQMKEPERILGHVIAHELGHLILGPGHTTTGIMSTAWKSKELDAIRQGRLKFNKEQRQQIETALAPRP